MLKATSAVAVAALLCATAACENPGHGTAQPSSTPTLAVASPPVIADWAKFTLGADLPHQTMADGLEITDIEIGSHSVARSHDLVTIEYVGWLSDGRQIASSDADGHALRFTLGDGEVIAGLDEGIPGMAVAGVRRLVVPPVLAYRAKGIVNGGGVWVIPPNATLVFVIRLIALTQQAG
jgi:hypothetical protein